VGPIMQDLEPDPESHPHPSKRHSHIMRVSTSTVSETPYGLIALVIVLPICDPIFYSRI